MGALHMQLAAKCGRFIPNACLVCARDHLAALGNGAPSSDVRAGSSIIHPGTTGLGSPGVCNVTQASFWSLGGNRLMSESFESGKRRVFVTKDSHRAVGSLSAGATLQVLDDSFEHEVWNDGDTARVVLIVDVWHPALSEAEREQIRTHFRRPTNANDHDANKGQDQANAQVPATAEQDTAAATAPDRIEMRIQAAIAKQIPYVCQSCSCVATNHTCGWNMHALGNVVCGSPFRLINRKTKGRWCITTWYGIVDVCDGYLHPHRAQLTPRVTPFSHAWMTITLPSLKMTLRLGASAGACPATATVDSAPSCGHCFP